MAAEHAFDPLASGSASDAAPGAQSIRGLPSAPHFGSPLYPRSPTGFDAAGLVRRVRRLADLSQRELARQAGVGRGTVGRAESGHSPISLAALDALLRAAGCRLAVLGPDGSEVHPMRSDAIRNNGDRRYPAHLDPRLVSWLARAGCGQHQDRPLRILCFENRAARDIRRASAPPLSTDHPGQDDQLRFNENERAQARRLCASYPPQPPEPDCACGPDCERECAPGCPCQCESADGASRGVRWPI